MWGRGRGRGRGVDYSEKAIAPRVKSEYNTFPIFHTKGDTAQFITLYIRDANLTLSNWQSHQFPLKKFSFSFRIARLVRIKFARKIIFLRFLIYIRCKRKIVENYNDGIYLFVGYYFSILVFFLGVSSFFRFVPVL